MLKVKNNNNNGPKPKPNKFTTLHSFNFFQLTTLTFKVQLN